MGTPLFPWQRYVADVALEIDPVSGEWVYEQVVMTAPRRAGKTHLIGPVTVHRCGQPATQVARLTAQTLDKAVERWAEVCARILATPIRRDVKQYTGNPRSLQWLRTRSKFAPFTPNEQGLHGEDPDLVWVDELQAFSALEQEEIEQGYEPIFSVKSGQAWLMSTAGTARSEWLNQVRRDGRAEVEAGSTSGSAYFEWSAPEKVGGVPLAELEDEQLLQVVLDSHPRRDHGLRPARIAQTLAKARNRSAWVRAYGNLTQSSDLPALFRPDALERAQSGSRIPAGARVALGVGVDPDRRETSIGRAWRDGMEVALTEDRRADETLWVASEVIRLVDVWDVSVVAIVNAGPGRDIADELDRAGVPLLRLSQSDHAAACARFDASFRADRPTVTWDGGTDFAAAVADAEKRRKPSGIEFVSRTGEPVTSIDARALAVWAADHAPEPEPEPQPFKIW